MVCPSPNRSEAIVVRLAEGGLVAYREAAPRDRVGENVTPCVEVHTSTLEEITIQLRCSSLVLGGQEGLFE
jgi:hypothetical protein